MTTSSSENSSQEGDLFPGRTYVEVVLEPAYNQARRELLVPLIAVNKAHLIMLHEQGLISGEDARSIAAAIRELGVTHWEGAAYSGEFEDLFFEVEHALLSLAGDAAGNLHLARSRNDLGVAIYRIVLREKLLRTLSSALKLHESLHAFATRHVQTIMIALTHTQQAQPTTLAHYTAAVNDSLERDIKRLQAAYANCNRSSLGAAALATSGYRVSRERVAELLAFDEIVENSYDAVSGADYVGEIASATQLASINLGRFVQDLLLWSTQEFAAIRVAAPYVQVSSIMPQKRNPVSIEHMRSLLSSAAGDAATVLHLIHNTPFGDIVDTEDDLQPYAWRSLGTLESVYRLLAKVIDTLEVNQQTLHERTIHSFATVTELADTLVREESLSFRTAHALVSQVVAGLVDRGAGIEELTLESLNEASLHVVGHKLHLTEEQLKEALDPEYFVRIRNVRGGPSPEEINRALQDQAERLSGNKEWLNDKAAKIGQAYNRLDETLIGWGEPIITDLNKKDPDYHP